MTNDKFSVYEEIDALHKKNNDTRKTIDATIQGLWDAVMRLETSINEKANRINELESKLRDKETDIYQLEDKVNQLESQVETLNRGF